MNRTKIHELDVQRGYTVVISALNMPNYGTVVSFATLEAGVTNKSTNKIHFDHIVNDKRQGVCEKIMRQYR